LTTAVITTERPVRLDVRSVTLADFDDETELVWGDPYIDPVELDEAWQNVHLARHLRKFEELEGFSHRRNNPRARSMQRCGCRNKAHKASHGTYEVRKDHGTTVRYGQIDAANASRDSRTKGSNRQQRRLAKLAKHPCNASAIKKLKRLGELMVD
jgi:hypothetical protein